MKIYLDTEFNGHGGQLISIALVDEHGKSFYGVCDPPTNVHPWVAEHVMPLVEKAPFHECLKGQAMKAGFHRFLLERQGSEVYADWPADLAHFANMMAGDTFEQAVNWQGTLHLIQTPPGEPRPLMPHNALSDAYALMIWHKGTLA